MDRDGGFERLLRGQPPETPGDEALGLFLLDVRGAFPAEPPHVREAHLDQIVRAAQLLADKGEPAMRPASKADGRARHASGLPKRRRVMVKVRVLRSLTAKVVAGLVVLMSMFGGLAFAGALPGTGDSGDDGTEVVVPQDVVTDDQGDDVAEVPEADDIEDETEGTDDVEDEAEEADDVEESEDADDQGEDADDQGEDADDQGEDADDQGEDESESDDDDQGEDESESSDDDDSQDESEDGDEGEDD